MSMKEAHESFSSSNRGPIHEDQRLQIEELDEWQTHKSRTHDKPKLHQNELNTFPRQLKVGDKVLLDAADPHIVTTTPNEEIPLTVLSIFPFGTVEHTMSSSRGKKATVPASKKRKGPSSSSGPIAKVRHPFLRFPIRPQEELFQILRAQPIITGHCINWAGVEQTMMTNCDDLSTVQFRLGGLVHQLSIPEFGTALGLYTEEFKEENDLETLNRHMHHSPSWCWDALVPGATTYNPSCSKALALPLSLRYLDAILAHMITGRRESTGIVNTHDACFLWCISHGHVIDLAYFIALTIQHQTERHRKGVISIGPYVMRLARHFGLLSTVAQESSLTLIGQMSP
ncbi:hypothetical protein GOBAR_AA04554 [Gossypium barbadense]|uniref:Uncharacterized protein n=1 Tax=Gossypium barbadense TaxID=3634 RepID=A0A2P5YKD2_GOSBA|nr:hypothetical protein GOBAR_AA04554 [Gossypium barbadense]